MDTRKISEDHERRISALERRASFSAIEAKELRECRERAGLTLRALGKLAGFSHVYIGEMERGEIRVPAATAAKLIAAFRSADKTPPRLVR